VNPARNSVRSYAKKPDSFGELSYNLGRHVKLAILLVVPPLYAIAVLC
jgi:hypothetical protein